MSTKSQGSSETWNSKIGVILAVAGTAIGIGNFFRFPGLAAQYGGGAFMLAYFTTLFLLGVPMGWMEWIFGRYGGQRGFNSPAGIIHTVTRHPIGKYIGVAGITILLVLYTYFSYVESWCLGYAVNFFTGNIHFHDAGQSKEFFGEFLGTMKNGEGWHMRLSSVAPFLLVTTVVNFVILYRGVSKGIEKYAKFAVPTLLILSLIVLVRVLTLPAPSSNKPELNINNGLGYMWNPTKTYTEAYSNNEWVLEEEIVGEHMIAEKSVFALHNPDLLKIREVSMTEQLAKPKLWLAAASQAFFSLSVGFGAIMVYASYTKRDDDLILSSLTSMNANAFAEVCLGAFITIPAAYALFGAKGLSGQGMFGLGFNVLPVVFSQMPLGNFFGGLFFLLLFLASITGALCMLQSSVAFIEEAFEVDRKRSIPQFALIAILGTFLVSWFSKDVKLMDTLDFWNGTFMIFMVSTINIILFGWVMGTEVAFEEGHRGAAVKIPSFYKYIIKFVCPVILIGVFVLWVLMDVLGLGGNGIDAHIKDLVGSEEQGPSRVAWLGIGLIAAVFGTYSLIASQVKKYR